MRICGFAGKSIFTVNVRLPGSAAGTICVTLPSIGWSPSASITTGTDSPSRTAPILLSSTVASSRKRLGSSIVKSGTPGLAIAPGSASFAITIPSNGARTLVKLIAVPACETPASACSRPAWAASRRALAAASLVFISSYSCGLTDFLSYSIW